MTYSIIVNTCKRGHPRQKWQFSTTHAEGKFVARLIFSGKCNCNNPILQCDQCMLITSQILTCLIRFGTNGIFREYCFRDDGGSTLGSNCPTAIVFLLARVFKLGFVIYISTHNTWCGKLMLFHNKRQMRIIKDIASFCALNNNPSFGDKILCTLKPCSLYRSPFPLPTC
jgi:hypothetical protein